MKRTAAARIGMTCLAATSVIGAGTVTRAAFAAGRTGRRIERAAGYQKPAKESPDSWRGEEDRVGRPRQISYRSVVSLAHPVEPTMPIWPGDPAVVFTNVATFPNDGYFLRNFSMGEHSATHMNAPNSFHADGEDISSYSAEQLVVPLVVIDARTQSAANSDYALTVQDVKNWERANGRIRAGSVVAMLTGWEDKWSNPAAFFGQDANGLHFPGFASETTHFLLTQRRVGGVGIDTHGVDPGQDTSYATNTEVLEQQRITLENLTNLDKLPPRGTTMAIGALPLKGGSGSPLQVLAFVP